MQQNKSEEEIFIRLKNAKLDEKYRKDFPFALSSFPEEDFYPFKEGENQLKTYRYKS